MLLNKLRMSDDNKKYVMVIDAESNGLYGPIFAYSIIIMDIFTGDIVSTYDVYAKGLLERLLAEGVINEICPFIIEHVYPVISKPPMNTFHDLSEDDLLNMFWETYDTYREDSVVIADFAAPVEANLFRKAVLLDEEDRVFKAPYPLHELGTLMLGNMIDPDTNRDYWFEDPTLKHNPHYDCMSTVSMLLDNKIL